eukprot:g15598.t1
MWARRVWDDMISQEKKKKRLTRLRSQCFSNPQQTGRHPPRCSKQSRQRHAITAWIPLSSSPSEFEEHDIKQLVIINKRRK